MSLPSDQLSSGKLGPHLILETWATDETSGWTPYWQAASCTIKQFDSSENWKYTNKAMTETGKPKQPILEIAFLMLYYHQIQLKEQDNMKRL